MEINSYTSDLKVDNYIEEQHKVFFLCNSDFYSGELLRKELGTEFARDWGTDEVTTRQRRA